MSSRRRRGQPQHAGNHERWLISYADFITLLFAFFVVLYASSQADQVKVRNLAEAIQSAFSQMGVFTPTSSPQIRLNASGPPAAPAPIPDAAIIADRHSLSSLEHRLQTALGPEIMRHAVTLQLSHQGLLIRLQEMGFFASGSATLQPASLPVMNQIAAAITPLPNPVRIEGHTDNVPIHNQEFTSNWQLSTARASAIVQDLITNYHMSPERLSAAGYAEYHPVASNATPAGRQRNRRVDVVVVSLEAARATGLEPVVKTLP